MNKYQVKVYNESDNSYRIAMETSCSIMAMEKMSRLSDQGHLVKIDLKPSKTPDHLKDVPSDRLKNLIELFKPRL